MVQRMTTYIISCTSSQPLISSLFYLKVDLINSIIQGSVIFIESATRLKVSEPLLLDFFVIQETCIEIPPVRLDIRWEHSALGTFEWTHLPTNLGTAHREHCLCK